MMHWQRGFKRLRLVAASSLILGVVLLLSVLITTMAGYGPNPGFVELYSALWPLGLMLIVLGLLLFLAVWVIAGFLPDGDSTVPAGTSRREPFYR